MSDDLAQAVKATLLPTLTPLGFDVVDARTGDSFDNASVVLQNRDLRIRVRRERGQLLVDFGPPGELGTWFDSEVVIQHLQLSSQGGLHVLHGSHVLQALAAFVVACGAELKSMFDRRMLASTKVALERLKEERAEKLFGWKPTHGRPNE